MLWKRLLFAQFFRLFFSILLCLFLIYVLVDFSVYGLKLLSGEGSEIALYYLRIFSRHLELFSSLAFLLAALKVLLDLSAHLEITALQMAGLSKAKILSPLFVCAGALSLCCYLNSQWLAPDAQDAADAFRTSYVKTKKREKREHVHNIALDDETELVYQGFDRKNKELFDVFWIKSARDIWYMKYLNLSAKPIYGRFVDHLVRNDQGLLEKQESFASLALPHLPWNDEIPLHRFVPFENRSLSTLFQQARIKTADWGSIASHLHYKLAMPLLPFIILFAISPIATQFSRTRPTFLIIACSLFLFVGFITLMASMLILGENRVLSPALVIWIPFAAIAIFPLFSFLKMR